jgi:hypothetical protein
MLSSERLLRDLVFLIDENKWEGLGDVDALGMPGAP